MQLDVWERLDGRRPIQLAIEGTSPLKVMEDLAADPKFTAACWSAFRRSSSSAAAAIVRLPSNIFIPNRHHSASGNGCRCV
jgi:hypothetical protein